MQRVSLVTVCFRSSSYVGRAVESFRSEAQSLGIQGEVVIVDHSGDQREIALLQAIAPDRLIVQANRGYAAGINAGVHEASGEIILVSNPDVELESGALGQLLLALKEHDIVGPQFVMGSLFFPPMEAQTPRAEVRRYLASLSWHFRRTLLLKEAIKAADLWEARRPVPVRFLVGALLAFRREIYWELGPWDEGYFLYFEETDWLLRAASKGLSCALVPKARAYHRWGASAKPSTTVKHMLSSRVRYYKKNFSLLGRLLTMLPLPAVNFPRESVPKDLEWTSPSWWLISPSPLGLPAFGLKAPGPFPEANIRTSFCFERHPRTFSVAVLDQDRRLYGPWRWDG